MGIDNESCRVGAVASVVRLGWGGQNRAERVDLGMSVTVWTEAGEMVFFIPLKANWVASAPWKQAWVKQKMVMVLKVSWMNPNC
jgi:hypothetical protein